MRATGQAFSSRLCRARRPPGQHQSLTHPDPAPKYGVRHSSKHIPNPQNVCLGGLQSPLGKEQMDGTTKSVRQLRIQVIEHDIDQGLSDSSSRCHCVVGAAGTAVARSHYGKDVSLV